ncbi:MAG: TIGR04133 family radical SAM/SPASM protein [Alistipes sp.]|jgi:radical SAM enzyme (rSAM/lipoprotein system)|nr:TIGR04133 family radical SAM/SPASM protein [Alistipes sp.]
MKKCKTEPERRQRPERRRRIGLRKWLGLNLFAKLYKERVEAHPLRTLFWECTLRCNLDCRHCGSDCKSSEVLNAANKAPEHEDMPLKDFLKTLDTITPHVDPHKVMIVFAGGEVLMRRDLERAGIEVYRRGYPWGMVTNGMALDAARFDSLLRAGLHSITLSLDGFESDHIYIRRHPRSFENALRALRLIVAEPSIVYDVVTCVTASSLERLTEFKEFLISEGVKAWRIFTIFPVGRAAEDPRLQLTDEQFTELMEFIAATKKEGRIRCDYACEGFLGGYETEVRDNFYHCSAGVTTAGIRIDGAISGCTSIRAAHDQGNIYRDDFWDVWSNRFGKFRDRSWARKGACAECKVWKWCLGNGMHLYDDEDNLLLCHYKRLR